MKKTFTSLMIAITALFFITPKIASAECLEWGEYTNNGWQYWPVTIDSVDGRTFHFHWGGTNINDKGVVIARLTVDTDAGAERDETVFKGRWSNDATGRWGKIRLFLKNGRRTARGYISFKNEGTENKALLRECGARGGGPRWRVDEPIKVLWKNSWYNARILRRDGSRYYISYDGYSSSWNEWVTEARMRKR
jgi:hypothetical protein